LGGIAFSDCVCVCVQDWWPEHFVYPLALHPTTPCAERDTAYRTFDRSFTLDDSDPANPKMVYRALDARDPDYVHTHFGAEGLCRTSNVDLDMQVMNKPRNPETPNPENPETRSKTPKHSTHFCIPRKKGHATTRKCTPYPGYTSVCTKGGKSI
jgi:hypothetical protein